MVQCYYADVVNYVAWIGCGTKSGTPNATCTHARTAMKGFEA